MLRINKRLFDALMSRGVLSMAGALMLSGVYICKARKYAQRVNLTGELLLCEPVSGSSKKSNGGAKRNGREVNLSLTDIETAYNEVRVRDMVHCADKFRPARSVLLFLLCAKELKAKLKGTQFELVLYYENGNAGTLKLCRVRPDDPSWLSDNIDAYSEPVAVYRN